MTYECAECGHLHYVGWHRGTYMGYVKCPVEGCKCYGQCGTCGHPLEDHEELPDPGYCTGKGWDRDGNPKCKCQGFDGGESVEAGRG